LQNNFFDTKLEYLRGVGTQKANLLGLELQLFTFADLLTHYPFRHEDRTKFYNIGEITEDYPYVQLKGKITDIQLVGSSDKKKRLIAKLQDDTGIVELVWFQGIQWVQPKLKKGYEYIVFGKPQLFGRIFNIAHPEIEMFLEHKTPETALSPIYSTTEKLKKRGLDSKGIGILVKNLLEIGYDKIPETLSNELIEKYKFIPKNEAIKQIHFPQNPKKLHQAVRRLKFEEFFFIQLKLLWQKTVRKQTHQGQILKSTALLTEFYKNHLPFDLTNAQKRVIKEIYKDLCSGKQMNRLLQGDVGSGKTIVAFICMLIAIDNGTQACLMAPTEILADQHYQGLKEYADKLKITIAKLTGSSKTSERKIIHQMLKNGDLKIIIGTHALIEEDVMFHHLGLCIIDEQHRFGVAQRAALWKKNERKELPPPHVLVMTATPIPRTLAMTLYGDLDVSVIDELPAGRKPIQTMHFYEANRLKVFGFLRKQIELGRQVYIVYPLIEESEALDYKNLMDGYESIVRAFPEYPISIVHGQMKAQDKDFEMQRFIKNETKIMVATTVIEVGVNVPNASVMVIEDAQRFGLSQLHQLRGRVGRGAEQSFCILMTNYKLSKEGKIRIETMVRTNNGFEIADIDLKLRGPGNLDGTQQSGVLDLRLGDIAKDQIILQEARKAAEELLDKDPNLALPAHVSIKQHLASVQQGGKVWSRIS
jgi:ATP-dependent DNA helicase RecG